MTELNNEMKPVDEKPEKSSNLGVSRRIFLGTGVAAAAVFMLPKAAKGNTTLIAPLSQDLSFVNGFPQPGVIANGTVDCPAVLSVTQKQFTFGTAVTATNTAGTRTEFSRCYNGQIPGPTFQVRKGERLNIRLENKLDPNPENCPGEHNTPPNCSNTTNLHFHGFHVSPMSIAPSGSIVSGGEHQGDYDEVLLSSDDVHYSLRPPSHGRALNYHNYGVCIPSFHAPGTHWYHPHIHGNTALQVINGMAGALIIEEEGEDKIQVHEDLVWMLQEVYGGEGKGIYTCGGTRSNNFTVNGKYQPTIKMKSGELHRWRFINATANTTGFMTLKFQKDINYPNPDAPPEWQDINDTVQEDDHYYYGVYRIAVDGISHYGEAPKFISSMELSPGNRADFLVKLKPGRYRVFKDYFQQLNIPGGIQQMLTQELAYVEVSTDQVEQRIDIPRIIPGQFPDYLKPFDPITTKENRVHRRITFDFDRVGPNGACQDGGTGGKTYRWRVNDVPYDGDQTAQVLNIDTEEIWELVNNTNTPHPFHIHVNPFQVIQINYRDGSSEVPTDKIWRDNFYIPPAKVDYKTGTIIESGSIKIRHRFSTYPGKFVFHCHILVHEDYGMMQDVHVNGTGLAPGQSVGGETFTYIKALPKA